MTVNTNVNIAIKRLVIRNPPKLNNKLIDESKRILPFKTGEFTI